MRALRTALALVLALALAAPAAAQDEDTTTPLLQAMAYVRPEADPVSVDFVDWAQLKRLYGSQDVTSASPLEERQRFLLEVARNESVPVPLGLDRLETWQNVWGWDTTDLDWQARYWDGRDVLRFGEGWDPAPFRAALRSFGYRRDDRGDVEVWLTPETDLPSDLLLERVGTEISAPPTWTPDAPVTVSRDGRTVVIHRFGFGASPKQLRKASRPNLERIVGTPAVRAASALGSVVAANIAAGPEHLCHRPADDELLLGEPEMRALVDDLHRYQARADGHTREAAESPAEVRYVFSYRRPRQARADLEGRAALVEEGTPWDPAPAALSLTDARVEGQELILDVQPDYGHPGPYTNWRVMWAPFAMCGSPA